MILEFLKQVIRSLSRTLEEKELQLGKALKVGLSLCEEVRALKQKMKHQRSIKKGDLDISGESFRINQNSINFNDLSSFYSASKQSQSDMSRPFLQTHHSWLLKGTLEEQNKSVSSKKDRED